jgi:hypothetical protein
MGRTPSTPSPKLYAYPETILFLESRLVLVPLLLRVVIITRSEKRKIHRSFLVT